MARRFRREQPRVAVSPRISLRRDYSDVTDRHRELPNPYSPHCARRDPSARGCLVSLSSNGGHYAAASPLRLPAATRQVDHVAGINRSLCEIDGRGAVDFFKTRPPSERGGGRSLQRTTYSNKSCGQKATSQAIEKSAELAPSQWLFGPENAI